MEITGHTGIHPGCAAPADRVAAAARHRHRAAGGGARQRSPGQTGAGSDRDAGTRDHRALERRAVERRRRADPPVDVARVRGADDIGEDIRGQRACDVEDEDSRPIQGQICRRRQVGRAGHERVDARAEGTDRSEIVGQHGAGPWMSSAVWAAIASVWACCTTPSLALCTVNGGTVLDGGKFEMRGGRRRPHVATDEHAAAGRTSHGRTTQDAELLRGAKRRCDLSPRGRGHRARMRRRPGTPQGEQMFELMLPPYRCNREVCA